MSTYVVYGLQSEQMCMLTMYVFYAIIDEFFYAIIDGCF